MEYVIEFFRDTLSGPVYIVTVVVAVILFFACIGYLAEKSINQKKEKEKYATVDNENTTNNTPIEETVVVNPLNDINQTSDEIGQANTLNVGVSEVIEPIQEVPLNVQNVDNGVSSQNLEPVREVVNEVNNDVIIPSINQDNSTI